MEVEGRSLPVSGVTEQNRDCGGRASRERDDVFTRYQNYQGVWMEKMRGTLMLVATVISTMTFQVAINPPGGIWQSDTTQGQGCARGKNCTAGTSVLAFSDSNQNSEYEIFIILCTISFSASQTIILLLISGFPLSNRVIMWVLIIAMCISVYCTVGAYIFSIIMLMHPLDKKASLIARFYAVYWVGLLVLLSLVLFLRLLFWLLKKCFGFLYWLLCCCTRTSSH